MQLCYRVRYFSICNVLLVLWCLTFRVDGVEMKAPNLKQWTLKGPLTNAPARVTDGLPLSDQSNKGRWKKIEALSDEFLGTTLDTNKWVVGLDWWQGRLPAWFSPTNIVVRDGQLQLTLRREKVPAQYEEHGYTNYTSAALRSVVRAGYGYYEVKAKAMRSAGSSSFWFQQDENPRWSSEIDVFEIGGKAKGKEQTYNMCTLVFRTPEVEGQWQVHAEWETPWALCDDFHVFGLEWGRDLISWYVDGVLVHSQENSHWHNPLYMIFDTETMPDWFGMPEDADLPSTYRVEYVRGWQASH